MVSRAVGAVALFVLAASSALAQFPPNAPGDPGMGGMSGPGHPGHPSEAPTSVDPMLGSGSSLTGTSGSRFWFEGGYQAGFIRDLPTPATLATRGGAFAVRGAPGVSAVLGGGNTDIGTLSGARFTGGFWLDSNRSFGLEASVFFLAEKSDSMSVSGNGAALSRPFFDTSIQAQNVRILNLPGQVSGSVSTEVKSLLVGADVGPVIRVIETEMITLDQLLYFRYLRLEETQNVTDTVSPVGGAITFRGQSFRNASAAVSVRDSALAINNFYGGGAGLRLGINPGRFSATLSGKIAVGGTSQSLRLDGSTSLTGTGNDQTAAGGLLIPGSSNGRYNQTRLTYMPEFGAKVGYQITQSLGVYVGYNFLYMNDVGRPGNNFTNSVNPTQLPSSQNFGVPFGPAAGAVQLQNSDFWMHTVGVGMNLKF